MSSPRFNKPSVREHGPQPMVVFSAPRMTRKESILKQEIDSYRVSDVDNTEVMYVGKRALSIYHSLDLPDAECDGYIFKQRLVQTDKGDCFLLARWKPDRHMRRTTPDWSQKWFVEKELFPPDSGRLFSRVGKRIEEGKPDSEESPPAEE